MKKILSCLILLTAGLVLADAEDPTALQVAPSDQVRYPDASQLLNKTDATPTPAADTTAPAEAVQPAPSGTVPLSKPLVAGTPVPAVPAVPAAPKVVVPRSKIADSWYLKWVLSGDETGVLGWAQALNRGASVHKVKDGLWEVWAGPFGTDGLAEALAGQAGVATLVKK